MRASKNGDTFLRQYTRAAQQTWKVGIEHHAEPQQVGDGMETGFVHVTSTSPTSREESLQEHLLTYTFGWHVGYICGVL